MRHQDKKRKTFWRSVGMVVTLLALAASGTAAGPGEVQPLKMSPKIVNGVDTHGFPSVVWLLGPGFCTGTLIGCETVLTAAHCFCDGNTAATCGTPDPANTLVYAQHGKNYGVSSIAIHPSFSFAQTSDLAVLKLSEPVTGIAPTPINTTAKPGLGSGGIITGFGLTVNNGEGSFSDLGLKRTGLVTTAACGVAADANHVCWTFAAPLGNPGTNSNTCQGDSGGPLFVNFGGGPVLAGVTSGGNSPGCLPVDASFDADVFLDRAWIQSEAGADIDNTICGNIPQAFEEGTSVLFGAGDLGPATPQARFSFEMPEGIQLARFTLNAEEGLGDNDFDLFVEQGSAPTTTDFDCGSGLPLVFPEFCELSSPAPGTWHILVDRFAGSGGFQTTVTLFGELGPCLEDLANGVACLQSGRFRLETTYFRRGVLERYVLDKLNDEVVLGFYNHDPTNLVTMQKVKDNCGPSDVFTFWWGGITRYESTVDLIDLQSGERRVYTSPAGGVPESIRDATWSCN